MKEKGETDKGDLFVPEVVMIDLMGRQIPVKEEGDQIRAVTKDKVIDPDSVRRYFTSKFGENLVDVTAAMEDLAGSYDPEELNRVAFRLYEKFRPDIPKGKKGWGAKGELSLQKICELMQG